MTPIVEKRKMMTRNSTIAITRDTKPRFQEARTIRNRQVGGSNPPGGSTIPPSRNGKQRRGFLFPPSTQTSTKNPRQAHNLPDTEPDTGIVVDTWDLIKHSRYRKKEKV